MKISESNKFDDMDDARPVQTTHKVRVCIEFIWVYVLSATKY